jgi:MFS family permease
MTRRRPRPMLKSGTMTMTSHQPPDRVRASGYAAAAWCLGFAGVSAWQVAADLIGQPDARQRYAADASGLAIMGMVVLVLKLTGAAVALTAAPPRPGLPRRPLQLLGVALWGAFGLLGLYSAGNLFITVGTVSGLLAPSAAWTAAGGVTVKAILYVLFFLAGSALFGVLAVWFHRRHHLRWTSAVAGLAGAPLLLALILAAAPAILGPRRWGRTSVRGELDGDGRLDGHHPIGMILWGAARESPQSGDAPAPGGSQHPGY